MRIILLLTLCFIVSGCTTIADPTLQLSENIALSPDTPLFLTAARQKENVKRALQNAGFHLVEQIGNSQYLLRVTIGIDQSTKSCGSLNNVKFDLRSEGSNLATAKAKGWTGTCQPNVLDATSNKLYQQLFPTLHQ